jgi:hypothetical protein
MKILKFFCSAIILVSLISCSTIVNTEKQQVKINSSPEKAIVKITNPGGIEVFNGETPVDTKLKRKFDYIVDISLPGYKSEKIQITKGFEPLFLGNLLCGGLVGMIIDFATGAVYKLEPDEIHVEKAVDDNGEIRTLAIPMTKL